MLLISIKTEIKESPKLNGSVLFQIGNSHFHMQLELENMRNQKLW